jgi:signal transduction histidine kinase
LAVGLLVGFAVVAAAEPSAVPGAPRWDELGWWLGLALVTLQAAALLRLRVAPRVVVVGVAAAAPVAVLLGLGAATGSTSPAVLVAAYDAAVGTRLSRLVPALSAAAALVGTGEAIQRAHDGAGAGVLLGAAVLQGAGTVGLAVLVAVVVRNRRELRTAREDQTGALLREHAALVQVAVARERTAMARELHDIAAHHLSGIAVMTGAIRGQIDTDPEGAKRAVEQVREQSRTMLRDLRSLVGLLREDAPPGTPPGTPRQETLAGIAGLVDDARATGADVALTVLDRAGGPPDIGPLAQLSAYRTVQEALANAARHAPGARCEVVVDARDAAAVRVTVENAAPSGPLPTPGPGDGGFGLVGMAERAELTDARLAFGPTDAGGWLVSLTLPVSEQVDGRVVAEGAR